MNNSTQNAPEHISAGLYRFGFSPDNGRRKEFSQWRRDVGTPIENYADVYVAGGLVELYQRPRNGQHILMRFSGQVDSQLDLIRLLWQLNFITEVEWLRAMQELAPEPPRPARRICVGSTGAEIIKTEWPAGFKRSRDEEEPPF